MDDLNLPEVQGEYRKNYDLSKNTWFKVGGPAEVFYKPSNINDLQKFLSQFAEEKQITVIGNCSNLIIRDSGIDGVVIKLGRAFAYTQQISDNEIKVGCGALNSSVAFFASQKGLSGLEFLIGIPGTIGGGIRMNAGAYGTEFKDIIKYFTAIDHSGKIHQFTPDEVEFSYRHCGLSHELIFIEAILKTNLSTRELVKSKMEKINIERSKTQPIKEKTGGSTFANPQNAATTKAWELIDQVGLRGYNIGGAMFSNKHCNFMINTGNATAKDLETLGDHAIDKVFKETGVKLRWEIRRIGKYK